VGGDQPERPRRDPVVRGHLGRVGLQLLAAGEVAPQRHRAEQVVGGERDDHHEGRDGDARRDPLRAEDGGREQHRDEPGRVVEVDRGLGRSRREQVHRELRNCRDQGERREHDEQREREQELRQIRQASAGEGRRDDPPGVAERRVHDPAGGAADLAVAREEARRPSPIEVRDHHLDRHQRDRDAGDGDGSSGRSAPVHERVPDSQPRDHERDLLLCRRGEEREHREREQAPLVEIPDGEQQQRARERDGMELVQRQPLGRRVDQVREREREACAL